MQKEILHITNSSYFSKDWAKKNNIDRADGYTKKELLKEACWNGLTPELIPECFDSAIDKSLMLWEINDADNFIDLVFCEFAQNKEEFFSVNPYIFMQIAYYN